MSKLENNKNLHGTTTVGLLYDEGVILSSDTRAIAGGYFIAHQNVKKILKIDDHIGMTIAGGVADAQNVSDMIKYHANNYRLSNGVPIPIKSAANLISNIFFSSRLYPLFCDILVGGYDKSGPQIFNIDLFGSVSQAKFVSTGSGSPVAYGILENSYKPGISLVDGQKIAFNAINAAISRNAGTGNGCDIVYINSEGFFELSESEKQKISGKISGSA